jgi:hypothetical protein
VSRALGWSAAFLALVALGAGSVFLFFRRRSPVPPRPPEDPGAALPMRCPACRRAFPRGTRVCPDDDQRLIALRTDGLETLPRGGRCPRCRRNFAPGTRYCPIDAEALVAANAPAQVHGHEHHHLLVGDGKICPVCAARYGLEASFCGRDGSELVSVN